MDSKSLLFTDGQMLKSKLYKFRTLRSIRPTKVLISISIALLIGCTDQPFEEVVMEDAIGGRVNNPSLTRLILVDAVTNKDISELKNGMQLNASSISVRAEGNAASVVFQLSGTETHRQVENTAPFSLMGDNSGNYNPWTPHTGAYSLTVTPYQRFHGAGVAGSPITVSFTVGASQIQLPESGTSFELDWDKLGISPKSNGNGYNVTGVTLPPWIENLEINNSGRASYVNHQILTADGQKVLKGTLVDDDPQVSGVSRAQLSIRLKDNLSVIHTKHRMYIHPDARFLETLPEKIRWFKIYELWNERDPNMDGNISGSARWGLNYYKEASGKFYWGVNGEYMQPQSKLFDKFINAHNTQVPVIFGEWFTVEMRMERGEKGRLTFTIQKDGGEKIVLFDLVGVPTIYPGRPDLQLHSVQAYKLYLDDRYIDYLRNSGKELSAMYSDFRFLKP